VVGVDRYVSKAELTAINLDRSEAAAASRNDQALARRSGPIAQASDAVTIAAGAIRNNALAAFVLGIVVAWLALRGLSRLDEEELT
jgi:hypothetical protein